VLLAEILGVGAIAPHEPGRTATEMAHNPGSMELARTRPHRDAKRLAPRHKIPATSDRQKFLFRKGLGLFRGARDARDAKSRITFILVFGVVR
jgi:hypothetical protein